MKAYRVSGTARSAVSDSNFPMMSQQKMLRQRLRKCTPLGSRHRIMRRKINIDSVGEIDPRTSTEPVILHTFRDEIAAKGGPIAPKAEEE